jgi:hypothetical protein
MQAQPKLRVLGQDETESTMDQDAPQPNTSAKIAGSKIALAMLPITPVPFSGTGAIYAWGRLLTYGALSVMLYNKQKTASYVFAGAAGLSLVTSLAAKSWEG